MKKYFLNILICSITLLVLIFYLRKADDPWGHILLPLGHKYGSNFNHEYTNEFIKGQKIIEVNEYTQDFDNTASTSIFAKKAFDVQNHYGFSKDDFSFVATFVDPDLMAAWAKKMTDKMYNDQGPIKSGFGHFYIGCGPRAGDGQEVFKANYPHMPHFLGDITVTPESARQDPEKLKTLMFNKTPKAFGLFEKALGPLTPNDRNTIEPIHNLQNSSVNTSGNVYLSMVPGQTLDQLTLNPNDTIYHMGGFYQRGSNPKTLGYNTGANIKSFQNILDHAAKHKKPVRIVNSNFCDSFMCSPKFWVTLVNSYKDSSLNLSPYQTGLIEEAICWQGHLDDKLQETMENNIKIVNEKQKSPIFADPLTVYIALSELFPKMGPRLYGKIYTYKPYKLTLHPEIEALAGGYMGTRSPEKGEWLQNPSDFFTLESVDEQDANVLITEPVADLTKEECVQFAEQGILEALMFSEKQKQILYNKLTA